MNRRSAPTARRALVLGALPVAYLLLFFAFPVAAIIARGFSAGSVSHTLLDARLRHIVWFTTWQAVASTVLTMAVGLPAAFVLGRYEFPGRRVVTAFVTTPFVLPTVVVGAALLAALPDRLHESVWAILYAHVLFNIAVVVRTVGGMWAHVELRLLEAARTLGASPRRAGWEVTLPLLGPSLAAAASLVFLFSFTSFGVVLLLGGPKRTTLEVEIYRQTAQLLRLDRAATLAIAQLLLMALLLVLVTRWQGRRSVAQRRLALEQRLAARPSVLIAVLVPIVAFVAAPMAVLAQRALRDPSGHGPSFANFRSLAHLQRGSGLTVTALSTVTTSVRYALLAAVIAFLVGGSAAFAVAAATGRGGRVLDSALMLPLGTSAVTLGFGFLIAFGVSPIAWRSRWFAIPLVHALVGLPFVVRAALPVLRGIDPRIREVAATLGASPWRVWREIDLPIAARSLAVGTGMAFAVSLGEFGAATFLARPESTTMPVAIARLLGRPGTVNRGQAMALAVLLALATAAVMALMESLRPRTAGEW